MGGRGGVYGGRDDRFLRKKWGGWRMPREEEASEQTARAIGIREAGRIKQNQTMSHISGRRKERKDEERKEKTEGQGEGIEIWGRDEGRRGKYISEIVNMSGDKSLPIVSPRWVCRCEQK